MVVVIIGAGFSGTLTAIHLARRSAGQLSRIILLDKRSTFGPGLAYSTPSPVHYLNVPAGNMSALEDDPQHFLKWAQARDAAVQTGSFLPRGIYGAYLQDLLQQAIAAHPGTIELRSDEASSLRQQGDGRWHIQTRAGSPIIADRVVLATGNAPPADIPGLDAALRGHSRYVADPWSPAGVSSIAPQEDILIVGAGLTMMDVVMQLHAQQHEGRILAISRHGLLPAPHRSPSRPPAHASPPAGFDSWDGSAKQLLRIVRRGIREHAAKGTDWRDVIASLRPVTTKTWQKLSPSQRARFLSRLRSYWDIVRHRAAPETAAIIADLRAAKQLVVRAGRIQAVKLASSADSALIEAAFLPRGSSNLQRVRVSRVINCMGPQTDTRACSDPLLVQLVRDGVIKPDPFRLGLESTDTHAAISKENRPHSGLFVVGPARRAQSWENTAVPELKRQAREVAEAVLRTTTA